MKDSKTPKKPHRDRKNPAERDRRRVRRWEQNRSRGAQTYDVATHAYARTP